MLVNRQNWRRTKEEFSIQNWEEIGVHGKIESIPLPRQGALPIQLDPDKERSATGTPKKHTKGGQKDPAYELSA